MITIDASQKTRISPLIYGVNFPDWKGPHLPIPLCRQGGNRLSAYNWETNASNAGADWHHQNDSLMGQTDEPGWASKVFMDDARKHGVTHCILTIPMSGYVAADKKGDGDVNQTPNYLQTRFYRSLPKKPGRLVYPPDITDKVVYEDEYVAYLEKIKGQLNLLYSLDNEPDIWSGTHARIVPKTPTYAEFIRRSIEYASAIKDVAPRSQVLGPASYGWQGFRRFQDASDSNNRDFLDVYLAAMRDAERKGGRRLLDALDIHFYPEAKGDGVRITEESTKPGTAAARIQAPRSLWDPTYVEDSWITQSMGNRPIALIPGIQKQIATQYPGTKLSISEYHYGGRKDISGAIAQADVLGIHGRYGVYASCIWGFGPEDIATLAGFRAFLDYDGKGGRFGNMGLKVSGEVPAEESVYAALDTEKEGVLTIVALNKTPSARPMTIHFAGFTPKTAAGYSFTPESLRRPQPLPARVQKNGIIFTAPPLSVNTLELVW